MEDSSQSETLWIAPNSKSAALQSRLFALLKIMRPKQWAKNGFIFAAIVFDRQLTNWAGVADTIAGLILFCLLSSAVYMINDLADLEADRLHPDKRLRPLPSGQLSPTLVGLMAALILAAVLPLSFALAPAFGLIATTYFVLMVAYTFWLKHLPLIDVLVIAAGFVLRVRAGVVLIDVERFSPWLYVVTTLLALYLGFGKRRAELAALASGSRAQRRVLDGYTLPLLDQLITIVSSTTIIAYSLYTFSAPNLPENHSMMLTVPFVIYSIFRYLYLVHVEKAGGAPEEVLFSDRPLQVTILLWVVSVLAIFYVL